MPACIPVYLCRFKVIIPLTRTGDATYCIPGTYVGIKYKSNSSATIRYSSCHFATAKLGVSGPSATAAAAPQRRPRRVHRRAGPPEDLPTGHQSPVLGHGTSRRARYLSRPSGLDFCGIRAARPRRRPRHRSNVPAASTAARNRQRTSPRAINRPTSVTGPRGARDICPAPLASISAVS